MAFKEIQFPVSISRGAIGGLSWQTRVVESATGYEFRDGLLLQPRGRWEVAHAARLPAAYEPLRAFFNAVRGRLFGFRFKDWSDYIVATPESALVTIDATHAQLAKRYTFGAETFDRKLSKIVAATFVPTGGSGLSLDYNTGILTFSTAPTSFTLQFDVPARFDTDEMRGEIIDRSGSQFIMGWSSIPIVAIRT
jgi:uncharacterized protein (TIGR02217 family)